MDIHFDCPHCTQPIAIDDSARGMQVECPNCQGAMIVPAPPVLEPSLRPTPPPAPIEPAGPFPTATQSLPDQYICTNPECGAILRESDLVSLEFRGRAARVCPKCRRGVRKLAQPGNFWADVPRSFVYPLLGNGLWILAAGTPVLLLFHFLGFGLITGALKVILLGVFGMLLQNVIRISADAEGGTMDWPDTADKSEFITAGLQIVVVLILVFAPAIVFLASWLFGLGGEYVPRRAAPLLAGFFGIAGLFYFPMALLALAMFDTINAANPALIIPAIVRTFLQYLLVIGLLAIMWCARLSIDLFLNTLPLTWHLAGLLPAVFLTFYTLVVGARLLGILYRHNASRLGWFE